MSVNAVRLGRERGWKKAFAIFSPRTYTTQTHK